MRNTRGKCTAIKVTHRNIDSKHLYEGANCTDEDAAGGRGSTECDVLNRGRVKTFEAGVGDTGVCSFDCWEKVELCLDVADSGR